VDALLSSIALNRPGTPFGQNIEGKSVYHHLKKIEHYEISGYGTVRSLARLIGEIDAANLLTQTLGEEESTDFLLTEISKPLLQQRGRTNPKRKSTKQSPQKPGTTPWYHVSSRGRLLRFTEWNPDRKTGLAGS